MEEQEKKEQEKKQETGETRSSGQTEDFHWAKQRQNQTKRQDTRLAEMR